MDQKNYIEINRIIGANEKTEISLKQLQIWQFLGSIVFFTLSKIAKFTAFPRREAARAQKATKPFK